MAAEAPQKPIHSLILDTGPLIKNAVSISTIINSAEEIFTTPAIISEIRDEATRSRVQTTLMPFLKIRNPSPASYDAVIAFSKKTGDYAVLSRQDLGILALAYEVHCERNGGPWGLREAPKQPVKLRPGEKTEDDKPAKITDRKDDVEAEEKGKEAAKLTNVGEKGTDDQTKVEEKKSDELKNTNEGTEGGFEIVKQKRGKRDEGRKQKDAQRKRKNGAKAVVSDTSEQPAPEQDQTEQPSEPVATGETEQLLNNPTTQDQLPEQQNEESQDNEIHQSSDSAGVQGDASQQAAEPPKEENTISNEASPPQAAQATSIAKDLLESQISQPQETEEPKHIELERGESEPLTAPEDLTQDLSTVNISTPPSPPATDDDDNDDDDDDDDDDDSDGDWITPSNLTDHQAKDSGLSQNSRTSNQVQMDVATMTIDFAMQNVLLQMNLHLLSTNMQRIKNLTSKVLRCHACFYVCREMTKQFCPRCGGASLRRVNCSTNSKGEFRLHLSKNYQWNKRGDRYSVPKPIAGTANTKWSGVGGGQGGWGRNLILAEDQKEYTKQMETEKRAKGARDLMDDDYLPGILTGDRSGRQGGRMKVGAGKNVNSKKRT